MTNPYNPLYYKFRDKYANLQPDILRWRVIANTSAKALPLAVVRERLRRRHKGAFEKALKDRGFDRDGQLLDIESKSNGKAQALYGTLEMHVYTGVGLHMAFPLLVKEVGLAVEAIRKECRNKPDRNGSSNFS